jgi:hypothetical protein
MSAFSRSIDSLFTRLGSPALFQPRIGANRTVTVIPKQPDEVIGLGDAGLTAEVTLFDMRVSEVAEPSEDDIVRFGSDDYRIIGTPRRDLHRLIWTVEAVKA